ncbi:hypothetical protein CEXT_297661 [Caerostris extrusa]|uniref:Uncharacterized protein n=1 Tax=Caerostris extrusa TaxID=172846 RepID=A0AAV4YEB4_CAEEX|nr:hypothetical protein CEXT_297661 [Caerostris extrusa]
MTATNCANPKSAADPEVSTACRFCGFFSIPHLSAVLQTLSSSRRKSLEQSRIDFIEASGYLFLFTFFVSGTPYTFISVDAQELGVSCQKWYSSDQSIEVKTQVLSFRVLGHPPATPRRQLPEGRLTTE